MNEARSAIKPVVQKYGGTSVESIDKIKAIARRVVAQSKDGLPIAVVVSAMAGETNRLVALVESIGGGSQRNYDMAVAAGEQVSVALMASAIEAAGGKSKAFLAYQLGIYTSPSHSKARIHNIDPSRLFECWNQGEIPIVAGFQGVTQNLEITTLGRGGSDTSAVALAVAVGAEYCEINTDVDGVFTGDPRVIKQARLLRSLDFESALELASLGSKVLHSRSVELAAKYNMKLVVRDTFNPNMDIGTSIMAYSEKESLEAPVVSGVTLDRKVVKFTVDRLSSSSAIAEVFRVLAKNEVNVDVITHNAVSGSCKVGFTVGQGEKVKALESLNRYCESHPEVAIEVVESLSKVSVVGLGMISHPGVAARVFDGLAANDIDIQMISTSEIKISCVVHADLADRAAQVLHAEFVET